MRWWIWLLIAVVVPQLLVVTLMWVSAVRDWLRDKRGQQRRVASGLTVDPDR